MAIKFNPFTGNFDFTGGGGGASYIDGEVATYNDLPLDGTAALNSAWLVRSSSGIWPFNKPAGIYYRSATAGVSRDADYSYGGTLGDVFSDSVFLLYDNSDTTRTAQFNLGSITAGQNRVLTWPNAPGTIARTEDFAAPPAIGSTTGAAGTFTTLTASTSLALTGGIITGASNVIEQVNSTSGQTFRLYNTQSGTGGVNFERLRFAWSSNVAIIGTEKGGTGTARALEFQTDGVKRLEIVSGGRVQIPHGSVTLPDTSDTNAGLLIKSNRSTGWPSLAVLTDSNTANDAAEIGFGVSTVNSLSSFSKIRCILGSAFNIMDFAFVLSGTEKFRIRQNDLITFGGITSSFPALKRSSATLQVRLADDSAFGALSCGALTLNGNLDASTRNIVTDTTTGTKIGTATNQLLGFYGATPVDRPATVADPAGGGTIDTEARTAINDIIDRLQELGLIA